MAYKRGDPFITRKPLFLIASKALSWLIVILGWPVAKALYRFTVTGRENLAALGKRPAVIVSNHSIPLDSLIHGLCILPRFAYFTVLEVTILTPFLGTLVRLLKGIPAPSDPARLGELEAAMMTALEGRGCVYFYSEGECFLFNQEIKPFKAGAFYCAITSRAAILPIVTVLKKPGRRIRAEVHILPAVEPPEATGHRPTDLHNAILLSTSIRADMQRVIDSCGGDKSLYRGPMPRIKGVNDKER